MAPSGASAQQTRSACFSALHTISGISAMGGEYEYGVVPGALKLKKGMLTKKPSKKPSKKRRSSKRAAPSEQAAPATTGEEHPESAAGSEQPPRAPTAAERRFEEMRRKRTLERIEKLAEKP
ncbi:hypothetical protein IWQ56_004933, partial [Coemansia nantahalensis]